VLAKSFRHGAEVLADHHAAMRDTLLRNGGEQRVERHLHIGAVSGREAVRHQIKPLQAEHVIETDRAGMAHRGRQHVAERLKRSHLETRGVEAGKPPVLAERIEGIGRRADGKMPGNRNLLVPGIEAVGLHADGNVEIEPDLHAKAFRKLLASGELAVRDPLQPRMEADTVGVLRGDHISGTTVAPVREIQCCGFTATAIVK
jgi:hypothetical protein